VKALVLIAAALVAPVLASAGHAAVNAYPSSTTVSPSGSLPPGGKRALTLHTAVGEREGGLIVVSGVPRVSLSIDRRGLGPLVLRTSFGHFVRFGSRLVPDALLPWDGSERATEQPNQPLYLQVEVPYGTKPGTYRATIEVEGGSRPVVVRVSVQVYDVVLPRPGAVVGSLLTSFHLSPETYVNRVRTTYGETSRAGLIAANDSLYRFLATYRLSPASWGFGEPRTTSGYASNSRWWLDSLANMMREMAAGPFSMLRIPISSNRTAPGNYIGGIDPFEPETWCPYLRAVQAAWQEHGWLASAIPYLFAYDEPGVKGQRLVAQQATVAHRCFPGARVLMTGNPSPGGDNRFLWDGLGGDDVDIWTVLTRRYYGTYAAGGKNRSRRNLRAIHTLRERGKLVWAYTYAGPGTPGLLATEPLPDPRLFVLWTALEGIGGIHYGEGTTSYKGLASPLEALPSGGEFALLYPGPSAPIPSARLEQIRDGIEDWEVLQAVRRAHGAATVRQILGNAGLFSAGRAGVRLACTVGCELPGSQPFAWPRWSRDGTTPARIERARLQSLRLASRP
jgi:hypothetical protein